MPKGVAGVCRSGEQGVSVTKGGGCGDSPHKHSLPWRTVSSASGTTSSRREHSGCSCSVQVLSPGGMQLWWQGAQPNWLTSSMGASCSTRAVPTTPHHWGKNHVMGPSAFPTPAVQILGLCQEAGDRALLYFHLSPGT